jgi:very-short-patch-repair endonuclease
MDKQQKLNLAKGLRRNQSDAEERLWMILRSRQLNGLKFRRQHPVGNYIVDFICLDEMLIIEADGGQHNDEPMIEKDNRRQRWLESEGFQVIRFWNNDILQNPEGVVFRIMEILEERRHPHLTSPLKGEG